MIRGDGRATTRDSRPGGVNTGQPVPLRLPDCRSTHRGQRSPADWTHRYPPETRGETATETSETSARLRVSVVSLLSRSLVWESRRGLADAGPQWIARRTYGSRFRSRTRRLGDGQ